MPNLGGFRGHQVGLGRLRGQTELEEQGGRLCPSSPRLSSGDSGPLCRSSGLQRTDLGFGPRSGLPKPAALRAHRYCREGWSRVVRPSFLRFVAVDDHPGPMDGIGSGDRGIPEARPTRHGAEGSGGLGGGTRRRLRRSGPNLPFPPGQLATSRGYHERLSRNGKAKGIDACPPVAIAETPPG